MRRILYPILLIAVLLIAACQPTADEALPTLAQLPTDLPTETLTDTPQASDTPEPTETDLPTATPSDTPTDRPSPTRRPTQTLTFTPSPTNTPEEATATPRPTENPTQAVAASATAAIIEAPRFATFTPVPAGVTEVAVRPTSTGTPLVAADVTILRSQMQEEVNRLIEDKATIQQAILSLSQGRINVELTAIVDGLTVRGTMFVAFNMMSDATVGNAVQILPSAPDEIRLVGGSPAPDGFIEIAYVDMAPTVMEAFSFIIDQRLGEGQHDLEFMTIDGDSIEIFLVVPAPAGN